MDLSWSRLKHIFVVLYIYRFRSGLFLIPNSHRLNPALIALIQAGEPCYMLMLIVIPKDLWSFESFIELTSYVVYIFYVYILSRN